MKLEKLNQVDLFNGSLNINPIPLEATQALTTTEVLMTLQNKINEAVASYNKMADFFNDNIDEKIDTLINTKFNDFLCDAVYEEETETVKLKNKTGISTHTYDSTTQALVIKDE